MSRKELKREETFYTIKRKKDTNIQIATKQVQIRDWIQQVVGEDFASDDFYESLEDGVLICKLLLKIKPGCIKKINCNTKLKWKMMENVKLFLDACKIIGVDPVFNPNDLIEKRNGMTIVNCFFSLSEIAGRLGFSPIMIKPLIVTFNKTSTFDPQVDNFETNLPHFSNNLEIPDVLDALTKSSKGKNQFVPNNDSQLTPKVIVEAPKIEEKKKLQINVLKDSKNPENQTKDKEQRFKTEENVISNEEKFEETELDKFEIISKEEKIEVKEKNEINKKEENKAQIIPKDGNGDKVMRISKLDVEFEEKLKETLQLEVVLEKIQQEPKNKEKSKEEEKTIQKESQIDLKHHKEENLEWCKELKKTDTNTIPHEKKMIRSEELESSSETELFSQNSFNLSSAISLNNSTSLLEEKFIELNQSQELKTSKEESSGNYTEDEPEGRLRIDSASSESFSPDTEGVKKSKKTRNWKELSRQSKNMKDIEKFYNKTENTEKEIEEKMRINKTQFISQLNSEENRIERLRIEILYEIIDSENIYIHDLETIVKLFLNPLKNIHILSENDIEIVFSNITSIYDVNKELQQNLLKEFQISNSIQTMNVGKIFSERINFFRIYSVYAVNHNNSITRFKALCKENKAFLNWLEEMKSAPGCKGVDLSGFLIKPIQRICKYPLLFKELLKSTPESHPDYTNIQDALQKGTQTVDYINSKNEEAEKINKMLHIQDALLEVPKSFGDLCVPGRVLVFEAPGFIQKDSKSKASERYFFLFNDLLLVTKPSKSKSGYYHFQGSILLEHYAIKELVDDSPSFELDKFDSKKDKWILTFGSVQEKLKWIQKINSLIESLKNLSERSMNIEITPKASPRQSIVE